ncbi:MAG: hypothetical protein PVG90_06545 [Bacillota bacterium]
MKVFHFGGELECESLKDLNCLLTSRYENDANEFELYGSEKYPFMTILVSNEWACVHFFESEDDCGRYAYCDEKAIKDDGYTTFYMGSPTSMTEISNKLVIPFSLALAIAQDFFLFLKISEKTKWFEL